MSAKLWCRAQEPIQTFEKAFEPVDQKFLVEAYRHLFHVGEHASLWNTMIHTGMTQIPLVFVANTEMRVRDFVRQSTRHKIFPTIAIGDPGGSEETLRALHLNNFWVGREFPNRNFWVGFFSHFECDVLRGEREENNIIPIMFL